MMTHFVYVALADTLGDNLWVALLVATVAAILTLVPRIDKKFAAICALHELVELPLDELMSVHLVNFALAHTNGTLASKASRNTVERSLADVLLD
jgi:hypothetical protein